MKSKQEKIRIALDIVVIITLCLAIYFFVQEIRMMKELDVCVSSRGIREEINLEDLGKFELNNSTEDKFKELNNTTGG